MSDLLRLVTGANHRSLPDDLPAPDRAALRVVARDGAVEDRARAVVILARVGDEAARPALAALLDGTRELSVVAAMAFLEPVADRYLDLLTPWLVAMLDPADPRAAVQAADTCGALRLAAAGPALVALARTVDTVPGMSARQAVDLLDAMARARPGHDAADTLREWLGRHPDDGPPIHFDPRPLRAVAEIARYGENGDREWAVRWCLAWLGSRVYEGADTAEMAAALMACGDRIVPRVEEAALHSPQWTGRESVFRILAALAPDLADRHARGNGSLFPRSAAGFLAIRYRGTGAPDVIAVLEEIAARAYGMEAECVRALIEVDGPRARRVAEEIVEAFAARDVGSTELPGLRSLVAAAAPAREIADEIVRLGLAPADAADRAVEDLTSPDSWPWLPVEVAPPGLVSPHDVLVAVLEEVDHVVTLGWEADDDPPAYDSYLESFVEASGGAIHLGEVTQTADGEFVYLTYDHRGTRRTERLSDDPTLYLVELSSFVEDLEPDDEEDPRRFVSLFVNRWVFADPKVLADFAERYGIPLE